jgi:hypothetical protein
VLDEGDAVDATVNELRAGDVAVMFIEDIGSVLQQLRGRGARPAMAPAAAAAAA